jgi:hypothetical protein
MNALTKGSFAAMGVASLLAFSTPATFAMDAMAGQSNVEINSLTDIPGDEQLEAAVTHDLTQIGITYDHVESLTLSQVAELKSIFDSSSSSDSKRLEAQKVLGM